MDHDPYLTTPVDHDPYSQWIDPSTGKLRRIEITKGGSRDVTPPSGPGTPGEWIGQVASHVGEGIASMFNPPDPDANPDAAKDWAAGFAFNTLLPGVAMPKPPGIVGVGGGRLPTPTERGPMWHSAVENAIESSKINSASPQQWLNTIKNSPGIKQQELDWLGLDDWLNQQYPKSSLRKQELQDFVKQNKMDVGEKVVSDRFEGYENKPIFGGGSSPYGGELISPGGIPGTYTEHILTKEIPEKIKEFNDYHAQMTEKYSDPDKNDPYDTDEDCTFEGISQSEVNKWEYLRAEAGYDSEHYSLPGYIAHIRHDDVFHPDQNGPSVDQNGQKGYKTLRIMEMQSDKAAKVKELQKETDPSDKQIYELGRLLKTPYNNLGDWTALGMKRMIRKAAEEGYDRIAWEPGQVHDERYGGGGVNFPKGIRNQEEVFWSRHGDNFSFSDYYGRHFTLHKDDLAKVIGEADAKRIFAEKMESGTSDFTVNWDNIPRETHEGLRNLYDKALPATTDKIIKKFGGQRGRMEMPYDTTNIDKSGVPDWFKYPKYSSPQKLHYFDITPQMRDAALNKGFPVFIKGFPLPLEPVEHDPHQTTPIDHDPFNPNSPSINNANKPDTRRSVPDWIKKVGQHYLDSIKNTLNPPDPTIDPEGAKDWAASTALSTIGMRTPFAETNALGIAGGKIKTPEQINKLKEMYNADKSYGEIAKELGVSRSTVSSAIWRFSNIGKKYSEQGLEGIAPVPTTKGGQPISALQSKYEVQFGKNKEVSLPKLGFLERDLPPEGTNAADIRPPGNQPREWTNDQIKAIKYGVANKLSAREIGENLGIPWSTVAEKAREFGGLSAPSIAHMHPRRLSLDQQRVLQGLRDMNWSNADIADHMGIHKASIPRMVKRYGIKPKTEE